MASQPLAADASMPTIIGAERPCSRSAWGIFSHSIAKFVRDFVFNLGFLDGVRGLISVGMHVYYTFWKYAKLWEMTQLKRLGKPVPLPKLDVEEERWELPWEKKFEG